MITDGCLCAGCHSTTKVASNMLIVTSSFNVKSILDYSDRAAAHAGCGCDACGLLIYSGTSSDDDCYEQQCPQGRLCVNVFME